jgi:Beta-glucan synthesis-associated protein SKN1/KRE6/Sbg1
MCCVGDVENWETIDLTTMVFPAEMLVDYVRVYQRQGSMNVGCNPKAYPMTDYIRRRTRVSLLFFFRGCGADVLVDPNATWTRTWTKPSNSQVSLSQSSSIADANWAPPRMMVVDPRHRCRCTHSFLSSLSMQNHRKLSGPRTLFSTQSIYVPYTAALRHYVPYQCILTPASPRLVLLSWPAFFGIYYFMTISPIIAASLSYSLPSSHGMTSKSYIFSLETVNSHSDTLI